MLPERGDGCVNYLDLGNHCTMYTYVKSHHGGWSSLTSQGIIRFLRKDLSPKGCFYVKTELWGKKKMKQSSGNF